MHEGFGSGGARSVRKNSVDQTAQAAQAESYFRFLVLKRSRTWAGIGAGAPSAQACPQAAGLAGRQRMTPPAGSIFWSDLGGAARLGGVFLAGSAGGAAIRAIEPLATDSSWPFSRAP